MPVGLFSISHRTLFVLQVPFFIAEIIFKALNFVSNNWAFPENPVNKLFQIFQDKHFFFSLCMIHPPLFVYPHLAINGDKEMFQNSRKLLGPKLKYANCKSPNFSWCNQVFYKMNRDTNYRLKEKRKKGRNLENFLIFVCFWHSSQILFLLRVWTQ